MDPGVVCWSLMEPSSNENNYHVYSYSGGPVLMFTFCCVIAEGT